MPIDDHTLGRLADTFTIDITTIGRRTGEPRRIEIWWLHVEGRFYITGITGPRHWYANLGADPTIVVHALGRNFVGTTRRVTDEAVRRRVFDAPDADWYREQEAVESLVATAPMVEVVLGAEQPT